MESITWNVWNHFFDCNRGQNPACQTGIGVGGGGGGGLPLTIHLLPQTENLPKQNFVVE